MTEVPARSPFSDLPPTGPVKHKPKGKRHTAPLEARLWDQVDKSGDCWLWSGARNWKGYGRISVGNSKTVGVHRVAYQLTHPDRDITGMQIDHTCHGRDKSCPGDRTCVHRRCVNPSHLEEVDNYTNTKRSQNFMAARLRAAEAPRTHCSEGHELTPDNISWTRSYRQCKTCKRAWSAEYYARPEIKARAAEQARLRYRRRAAELEAGAA